MDRVEVQKFAERLKSAIEKIGPEYYQIPSLQGKVIYSERAFAYELYHQMRIEFGDSRWYVNGELRKTISHIHNSSSKDVFIPDLIVHKHEDLDSNIVAIELKASTTPSTSSLIYDLEKLKIMTSTNPSGLRFLMGVLLVINCDFYEKWKSMRKENRNKVLELLKNPDIRIWNIGRPHFPDESSTDLLLINGLIQYKSEQDLLSKNA